MSNKKVKKDFDKERMYAKIMPTVFDTPPESIGERPEDPELAEQLEQNDGYSEEFIPTVPPPLPEPKYILRNYIEDIMMEKYAHTMKMLKVCACEKCTKDILAHALNALPPSYMAVPPEHVDGVVRELRAALEVKVSTALIQAVQHVKANPQH
jgi:hypothetical protein